MLVLLILAPALATKKLRDHTSDMYEASEGPAGQQMPTLSRPCKSFKTNALFRVYTVDGKSRARARLRCVPRSGKFLAKIPPLGHGLIWPANAS